MTIANILSEEDCQSALLQVIKNVEEAGGASLEAYADSKDIPTIGIGMNLRDENVRKKVK